MNERLLRPFALVLALAPLASAPAQMSLETSGQFMTNVALGQVMPAAIEAAYGRSSRRHGSKKSGPSLATLRARLGYVRNRVRRAENLQAFIAGYKKSPTAAAEVRNLFAKNPVEPTIRQGMSRYGLSTANLADVTATYLASAYLVSRGSMADPTKAQMIGLRDQVVRAYAATPKIARASDATKQKLADMLMAQMLVDNAMLASAKGDPTQSRRAASNVGGTARLAFGLDLAKYDLTSGGLARK